VRRSIQRTLLPRLVKSELFPDDPALIERIVSVGEEK
jgi:hypothetical protein